MTSPTCGESRISVCRASGTPLKFCKPLSAPPMREPRPPARIRPVIASACSEALLLLWVVKLASYVAHLDTLGVAVGQTGIRRQCGAQLGIAIVAPLPDMGRGRRDLLVGIAAAQQGPQILALAREQA